MATKKRIAVVASCVAALVIGAVSIGAASADSKKNADPPEPVDSRVLVATSKPARGDIIIQDEFVGKIDPDRQVTVYPKAAGEVIKINYDVGDYVEAGAVLFEIDSKALQTQLKQTRASLAAAQSKANKSLEMAQVGLETAEFNAEKGYESQVNAAKNGVISGEPGVAGAETGVESAKNAVYQANAGLITARRTLKEIRDDTNTSYIYSGLDKEQAETQAKDAVRRAELAVEAAELGLKNAELGLQNAKNALGQAKESVKTLEVLSREQRVTAKKQVEMAALNANLSDQYLVVEKMQEDLLDYQVKAQISGVIEQRNIDEFSMVSQGVPTFVIANTDAMTVSFNVSETALAGMKTGDKVSIEKNGRTVTAEISEISSTVDARSGLFKIEATVTNPPEDFYSGTNVKIFVDTQKALNTIIVPIDAVYYEKGKPYVYIVENNIAKKTFIETGISNDDSIQVISGLTANDDIVTTWSSSLSDGAEIKLGSGEE